jgi:glutamyl-tRNA synthetase
MRQSHKSPMAAPPIVRFAPSPTGLLHVGNIRAALFNWLFARRLGGTFVLRLDDTDRQRSKPEYETAIEQDLAWLGLRWDQKERQSDRLAHYDTARDRLIASGRLYPCYETPEELDFKRKRLQAQGRPPVYDRAALKLDDAMRAQLEAEGRKPHWRFKLIAEEVRWDDLVRGAQHVDEASQSDPVLVRADGSYLYSFTSVVDDIDMAITHVIRGEDHVTNTGAQIQMFQALGAVVPVFAHLPLLVDAAGAGLSKRTGSLSIGDLRTSGIEALAIDALLARIGTADSVEPVTSLDRLVATVDFARVGRAAARFSEEELAHLSARTLHAMPYDAVRDRLGADFGEALWLAVRGNLAKLEDAKTWAAIVRGEIAPTIEDAAFLAEAAGKLPPEPWDETTWKGWTSGLGRKGKALFHPLRLALTARENGPEMAKLLPLIGRAKAEARLNGRTA